MTTSTTETLQTFASAFAAVMALVAAVLVYRMLRNWQQGTPLLSRKDIMSNAGNLGFILWVMFIFALQDALDQMGWHWSLLFLFPILAALPFILLAHQRMKQAQKNAIANPDAKIAVPAVAASAEEKSVSFKINAILIGFVLITIGPILWLAFMTDLSGFNRSGFAFLGGLLAYCAMILVILVYGIAGRWPGSVSMKASIEINATPQQIWNVVRFRNSTGWWKKIVSLVQRLDEPGEVYDIHYFNSDTCGTCSLPRNPDLDGAVTRVEILKSQEPTYLAWRAYPQSMSGAMSDMMAHEDESLTIDALSNGMCRVSADNLAVKPKVWLAALLKLGNPPGQELAALKAHIEGQTADTMYDVGAQRIDAARHAQKFCGCAKGASTAGLFA